MSEAFDLHWDRGWEFYEAENFEEAITEWRIAGEIDPEDGYVNNNIGQALSELDQKDAAFSEWQKAVYLEPKYNIPYIHLADALLEAGYASEAFATIHTAIRLCPPSANLYIRLGHYLAMQADENGDKARWEAATIAFQQAIDIEPTNSYARQYLARTQWARGNKGGAIKILKGAIADDPNDADAYILLWNYQSKALHFHGMVRTTYAMNELPESEALNEHYAYIDDLWPQTQRALLTAAGLVAAFVGTWVWNRRRRT